MSRFRGKRRSTDGAIGLKWLAVLAMAAAYGSAAYADAQWQYNPRVVVTGIDESNYQLAVAPGSKFSVAGSQADASVQIHGQWPTTSVDLWPYVSGTYLPGHTELDDNLEFLSFNLNHTGQRFSASLASNYSERSLLQAVLPSTLPNSDLGQPSPGTNPGLLEQHNRQDLLVLTPSGQFAVTQRNEVVFVANFLDGTYAHQNLGGYVNYSALAGSVGWAYEVSPRGSLTFSGTASEFSPSHVPGSNTYGLEVDWSKQVTQTGKYYLRLGGNRTNFDSGFGAVPTAGADTLSAGAGVSWAFRVTNVFLDMTRTVSPSPSGYSVVQNQARFRLERQYSQRLAAFVGLVGVKQDPFGSGNPFVATSYVSGDIGLEWRATRAFALVGAYGYQLQKFSGSPNADSNTFRVSLVYELNRAAQGPGISVPY